MIAGLAGRTDPRTPIPHAESRVGGMHKGTTYVVLRDRTRIYTNAFARTLSSAHFADWQRKKSPRLTGGPVFVVLREAVSGYCTVTAVKFCRPNALT